MKLQPDSFSCGVYAVMNAAKALGINLRRKDIIKYSGTTKTRGTNEKGIINTIINNKLKYMDFNYPEQTAFYFLNSALNEGRPVILCVDEYDHWCTIIGKLNNKYILFDSLNKEESGIEIVKRRELTKRWKYRNRFYGIVVSR